MTDIQIFKIVQILWFALPMATAIIVYVILPVKLSKSIRALLGVMCGWLIAVVLTIAVYNPSGIAAGYEAGLHFPESKYDNNTIAVSVVTGWFYPLLALGCMWVISKIKLIASGHEKDT